MGKFMSLLALGLLVSAPSLDAQRQPDLSGSWTLVHKDDVRGEPLGVLGEMFVAAQTSTSLTVDWHSTSPAGRGAAGKLAYRPIHSTFPFDGTESNITTISSSGSITRIMDTAGWVGQKLVVSTTWRGNRPPSVSRTLSLWLEADGTLIAEARTPPTLSTEPWTVVQSAYRRTDQRRGTN